MQSIVITDLHLRDPDGSPEAAAHAARIGERLDRISEAVPEAEFCILMGDLTDAGEDAAYRWLKRRLDELPFPSVPMLGNHDDRQAFCAVFRRGEDHDGFVQSSRRFGEFRFVFLDTHVPGEDWGYLCEERLAWLDTRLGKGGDVCLFLHHPPCDIGDPVLDPIKLSNASELARLLRQHGNVRQIVFGHVHRTMFLLWNGIPCASLDSLGTTGSGVSPGQFGVLGQLSPGSDFVALTFNSLA